MTETNVETAKQLGLLPEEFDRITEILGRKPNFCELSIYSVMWSEHCSYKNSITWLKTLPRESDKMLAKAGEENAGLIDIGDGLACCFKIESHNHPSAIEPYQGAATGVGGINRDIFSMGARPIAQLNSLRFGNLTNERTQWLVKGVVKGIGDYGNAFGIPTVGGEVYFDDCYQINPLVNAMSVGIVEVGKTASASAGAPGYNVYIFGSSTGKDGIHGAAFASKDITEDSAKDLPSVQVGDPFWEKLILEATLALIETGGVAGLQDMGAAGITCSTSEMSAKDGLGMDIHLDRVPARQPGMKDWELLLSESQERMLVVVKPGFEQAFEAIFTKWDLTFACIGKVTDSGRVRYFMHGEVSADIPAESLVLGGGAPVYKREWKEPAYMERIKAFSMDAHADLTDNANVLKALKALCNEPNIASKRWVFRQYDSMVGTINQTTNAPSDAAVVDLRGTSKSLAMTVDCNSRYVFADPFTGGSIAVAEAARNLVCSGATPLGVTNCLNFGNPYNPEVYYQFKGAIEGMGAACRAFDTPVTGGNVSFYNQSSDDNAVYPTPTIGMVGLLPKSRRMTLNFKAAGHAIYVLGHMQNDLGSSQYLAKLKGVTHSPCPYFNLDEEKALHRLILALIEQGTIQSAHDVSEGGLAVAVYESAKAGNIGVVLNPSKPDQVRHDAFWFGEAQGRVVVSVRAEDETALLKACEAHHVPALPLGVTAGQHFVIGEDALPMATLTEAYETALEKYLA